MIARNNKLPLFIIDTVGICAVATCVFGVVWLTLVRGDHATSDIRELNTLIQRARDDLATLRSARDEQEALLAKSRAERDTRGHLPTHVPIEEYFQTLSALTTQHHLRVLSHNPVSPRQYPGLLEQRYAYELAGSMPDLACFFRAIEDTDFWADVSYFKIDNRQARTADGSNIRVAKMTISLFSAVQVEGVPDNG